MADIFSQLLFRPTADQAAGLQRSHLVMQAAQPSKLEGAKANHLPTDQASQTSHTIRSAAYAPPLHQHSKTEQNTMLDEAQDPALKPEEEKETKPWFGDDGFTFLDVLDAINPLQNIPIVNTIYRQLSNDDISKGARLMGGTLYGGPIGFVGALADISTEEATGQSIGGHITNLFINDEQGEEEARSLTSQHNAPPDMEALKQMQMEFQAALQANQSQANASKSSHNGILHDNLVPPMDNIYQKNLEAVKTAKLEDKTELALNLLDKEPVNTPIKQDFQSQHIATDTPSYQRKPGHLSPASLSYLHQVAAIVTEPERHQSIDRELINPTNGKLFDKVNPFALPALDEIDYHSPMRRQQSLQASTSSVALIDALRHYETNHAYQQAPRHLVDTQF